MSGQRWEDTFYWWEGTFYRDRQISDSKLAETQTVADSGFLVKMRSQVFVDKGRSNKTNEYSGGFDS